MLPAKPQALWRRIQCNAAWIYPGFARCKTTPWKCCWGMVFVWKIGMKCTLSFWPWKDIWFEQSFDSWILMKMNWNPACSDIFGQGQMPHLFWCWILQSCARPLIVDKGNCIECSAGVKTTTCKIVPCGVESFYPSKSQKLWRRIHPMPPTATNQTQICAKTRDKPSFQTCDTRRMSRLPCPILQHCESLPYERVIASLSSTRSVKKTGNRCLDDTDSRAIIAIVPSRCQGCLVGPGLQKPVIQSVFCQSNWIGTIENSWDSALKALAKGFQWHLVAAAGWRKLLVSGVQVLCILEILHCKGLKCFTGAVIQCSQDFATENQSTNAVLTDSFVSKPCSPGLSTSLLRDCYVPFCHDIFLCGFAAVGIVWDSQSSAQT